MLQEVERSGGFFSLVSYSWVGILIFLAICGGMYYMWRKRNKG